MILNHFREVFRFFILILFTENDKISYHIYEEAFIDIYKRYERKVTYFY